MQTKNKLIKELILDKDNPNEMTEAQMQGLTETIAKYGFIVPVIVTKNGVVADGHQRIEAAKKLGYTEVPVIELDIEEPDRLILQQVLNKLKGQHKEDKDAVAFQKILEASSLNNLATYLGTKENRLMSVINKHLNPAHKGAWIIDANITRAGEVSDLGMKFRPYYK